MRDQVKEAAQYGLRSQTLNSDQEESEHLKILEEAKQGKLDLLFIAPERIENNIWKKHFQDTDQGSGYRQSPLHLHLGA